MKLVNVPLNYGNCIRYLYAKNSQRLKSIQKKSVLKYKNRFISVQTYNHNINKCNIQNIKREKIKKMESKQYQN